jgi:16S rRNA processing protein RimM
VPPGGRKDGPGAAATRMEELILVGRVARAHGNKGQVIVNPDTDFPDERFTVGAVLLVGPEATPRTIRAVRFHQRRPVLALEGVETMDDAEALAGAELKIPAAARGALPEGTFYHDELIGCEVRDTSARIVGRVSAVEGTMEMSRLVVEGRHGDVLIPLADAICVSIDVGAREIVVAPPEGLLELNERGAGRQR